MNDLSEKINLIWQKKENQKQDIISQEDKNIILDAIELLDKGKIRSAQKIDEKWQINGWVKKAILLYFKILDNHLMHENLNRYFDKIPLKYANYEAYDFAKEKVRVVPPATVRKGSFIGENSVLMPSYINIGAYVDKGSMIDTWATIGSCAQIGKNVHISGGVGIGGVLEPLQAFPTIIEDNCFIGARSEIVEGVIVEQGCVLAMGVYLSQSTKIYSRLTKKITYGKIPKNSVVIPGSIKADENHFVNAAIIIKEVDQKTREKTSINELLRE